MIFGFSAPANSEQYKRHKYTCPESQGECTEEEREAIKLVNNKYWEILSEKHGVDNKFTIFVNDSITIDTVPPNIPHLQCWPSFWKCWISKNKYIDETREDDTEGYYYFHGEFDKMYRPTNDDTKYGQDTYYREDNGEPFKFVERLIDNSQNNGVSITNKIFGGAILNKSDCSLVLADTNHELENPIWHGEMYVLKKFYEQKNYPPTKDLIFLSTHEPCSMCLSAITWAGFDNFIYLFSYQESRDLFAIPHDLNILNQVFNVQDGNYKKSNQYWTSYSIDEILNSGDFKNLKNLKQRVTNIKRSYDELSELYQQTKDNNDIPLN